jgi:MFS family permease
MFRAIAAAVLSTTVSVLPVFLVGSLAVFVAAELHFGVAELGVAVASYYTASAISSVPAGRLAERIGARKSMVLGSAACAAALLFVAVAATDFPRLVLAMLVAGGGNAMTQLGANLGLARAVPQVRQGLAFGIKQAAIPVATLLGGLAVPAVALTIGWRWAFVAAAILFLPVLAVAPATGPRPPRRAGPLRAGDVALKPLAVLAFASALGSASVNALGAFFVKSTVASGLDVGAAGLLLAVASAIGVVARIWNGHRADQRGGGHLTQVALLILIGGVAMAMLAWSEVRPLLVVASVVAFGAGWGWNGLFTFAIVRYNQNAPAAATGITQLGLFVGGVIGPLAFGATVERASYAVAWLGGAAALFAAAGLILVGRRMLRRDVEQRAASVAAAMAGSLDG